MSATFITEIKKRHTKPIICVQIDLPETTLYLSDIELRESTAHWKERLENATAVNRSFDLKGDRFNLDDVTLSFNNKLEGDTTGGEGYFDPYLRDNDFENATVTIYIKAKTDSGNVVSQQVYAGKGSPISKTQDNFVLRVRNQLRAQMKNLQRPIDGFSFPDVPAETSGKFANIGGPLIQGPDGIVQAHVIDEVSGGAGSCVLMLFQHPVFLNTGTFVLTRVRGDVKSTVNSAYITPALYDIDDMGRSYSNVQVGSPAAHQAGDKYYCRTLTARLEPLISYVELDGTNDWFTATAANSPLLPGRTGVSNAFTVEFKIDLTSIGRAHQIGGIWESGSNKKSWLINIRNTNTVRIFLSDDGSSTSWSGESTTTLTTSYYHIIRVVFYADGTTPRMWIDDSEETLSTSGTVPATFYQGDGDFQIGTYDSGTGPMAGRIFYAVIAAGAQPVTNPDWRTNETVKGYRQHNWGNTIISSPLENIISEWHFTYGPEDLQGNTTLTETSVSYAGGDYDQHTQGLAYYMPFHWILDTITEFAGLKSPEIDHTSFERACYVMGHVWQSESSSQFLLPTKAGELYQKDNPWDLLIELLRSTGYRPTISLEGKIKIIELNTATVDADNTRTQYIENKNDFLAGIDIDLQPTQIVNRQFFQYWLNHYNDSGIYAVKDCQNEDSQGFFGIREQTWLSLMGGDESILSNEVIQREMITRSGRLIQVQWTVPGLWGMLDDLGDIVEVTHRRVIGDWDREPVKIIGQSVNLQTKTVTLTGVPLGGKYHVGEIEIVADATTGGEPEEKTVILYPSADTYVTEENGGTAYGTADHYFHGEIYNTDDDQHKNRMAMYFDLSSIASDIGTGSVLRMALHLHVISAGPTPSRIHIRQLLDTTWSESSTYNSFNGGGWSDANIGNEIFDSELGGIGKYRFEGNSTGITLMNTLVGGTNQLHITHQAMNYRPTQYRPNQDVEWYKIASRQNTVVKWRPRLVVVYSKV